MPGLTFSFLRGGTALGSMASPMRDLLISADTHSLKHVSNDLKASVSKSQIFLPIDAQAMQTVFSKKRCYWSPRDTKGQVRTKAQ